MNSKTKNGKKSQPLAGTIHVSPTPHISKRAGGLRSKPGRRLTELAQLIVSEAEALFYAGTLGELVSRSANLKVSEGIDFYAEVIGFEVDLIKLALAQTSGNQTRAARLLRLNPTTLNAKIKQYGISM